jgi:hypothetical protein
VLTWTFRKVNQKHLDSFEMWCWRRKKKIGCGDRAKNEVLRTDNETRSILHNEEKIGHILRRNCLLKNVTEVKQRGDDSSDVKTRKNR